MTAPCRYCHRPLEEHRDSGPDARMLCLGKKHGFAPMEPHPVVGTSPPGADPHRAANRRYHDALRELSVLRSEAARVDVCVAHLREGSAKELVRAAAAELQTRIGGQSSDVGRRRIELEFLEEIMPTAPVAKGEVIR